MHYGNIKTLKEQVEYCLKEFPQTRDSDITLTLDLWSRFWEHYVAENPFTVSEDLWGRETIDVKALFKLPSQDAIKRVRAYWQNTRKKYPPTVWEVAKKRNMLEDDWRVAMGYPTRESAGTGQPSWDLK